MRTKLTVTVRQDTERESTVIFRGESGEEIGSVVVTLVPKGVRVDGFNADDTNASNFSLILHG